jgi:hypothetical protein
MLDTSNDVDVTIVEVAPSELEIVLQFESLSANVQNLHAGMPQNLAR